MLVWIKTIVAALLLAGLVYGVFFVDLGDKSFAEHTRDVWQSPTMQEKTRRVVDAVKEGFDKRFGGGKDGQRKNARHAHGRPTADLSESDRKSLNALIDDLK